MGLKWLINTKILQTALQKVNHPQNNVCRWLIILLPLQDLNLRPSHEAGHARRRGMPVGMNNHPCLQPPLPFWYEGMREYESKKV